MKSISVFILSLCTFLTLSAQQKKAEFLSISFKEFKADGTKGDWQSKFSTNVNKIAAYAHITNPYYKVKDTVVRMTMAFYSPENKELFRYTIKPKKQLKKYDRIIGVNILPIKSKNRSPGTYKASVFFEGNEIGSDTFQLIEGYTEAKNDFKFNKLYLTKLDMMLKDTEVKTIKFERKSIPIYIKAHLELFNVHKNIKDTKLNIKFKIYNPDKVLVKTVEEDGKIYNDWNGIDLSKTLKIAASTTKGWPNGIYTLKAYTDDEKYIGSTNFEIFGKVPDYLKKTNTTIKKDGPKVNTNTKPTKLNLYSLSKKFKFRNGSSTLTDVQKTMLKNMASAMKKDKNLKLKVECHTGSAGSSSSNLKLTQEQANEIRNYLINAGISYNRIKAKGYGESKPIVPNNSTENKQKNYRVEFSYW